MSHYDWRVSLLGDKSDQQCQINIHNPMLNRWPKLFLTGVTSFNLDPLNSPVCEPEDRIDPKPRRDIM